MHPGPHPCRYGQDRGCCGIVLRPPSEPLQSLALPAGSLIVLASAIALRSNNDGEGVTRPSEQARRNARTSSAPSRKPIPRTSSAAGGTPAASRASRNSASRHRSATTRSGRPKRSMPARSRAPTFTARWPSVSNSPRSAHSRYKRPTPSRSPRSSRDGSHGNAAMQDSPPVSGQ